MSAFHPFRTLGGNVRFRPIADCSKITQARRVYQHDRCPVYAFRNVLHLAAACATLLAAPASGQLKPEAPIGSRLAKPLGEYPIDDTRRVLADFGACVVKREPQLARDLLLKSTQYSFAPEFQKLPTADCLGSAAVGRISGNGDIMLQTSPAVMRLVTAEALVRQDLANLDPQQLKSACEIALQWKAGSKAVAHRA